MPSERLVLPPELKRAQLNAADAPTFDGALAHHLLQVARLSVGDTISVGDGAGATRAAVISAVGRKALSLEWCAEMRVEARSLPELVLLMAMIDHSDLRRAVEGVVEAGVDRIVLFRAHYSNRPVPNERDSLWEKLRKIIRASAEQARRPWIPELEGAGDIHKTCGALTRVFVAQGEGADLHSVSTVHDSVHQAESSVGILVGPEGGWTANELAGFAGAGIEAVRLGGTVLRARTAAVIAAHHLQLARVELP